MLKIVHVGFSDTSGGAAIAAYRLHRALIDNAVDSRMVVLRKDSSDPTVACPLGKLGWYRSLFGRSISRCIRALQPHPRGSMRSINWLRAGFAGWLNSSEADVVNLHWVGAETISIAEIAAIRKPIVWTLHDMWPFCGTEHYERLDFPGRFTVRYEDTKLTGFPQVADVDAWNFNRKERAWGNKIFHLACPSQWMSRVASDSSLFGKMPSHVIPNGVDTEIFAPHPRTEARRALKLPSDGKLILFGAANATTDPRKGLPLLLEALKKLSANRTPDERRIELMIFGTDDARAVRLSGCSFPVHTLGNIKNVAELAQVYSAADVFVAPSLQDNLPNTLIEAHSCGTPCVAFDVGGIADIIIPGKTGFLAKPFDIEELTRAVDRTIRMEERSTRDACRRHAQDRFSDKIMAGRYTALYDSILTRA